MSKYSKIESLENWVTWSYLRDKLKWPTSQVAYEMEVNERRLVEWVNARASAMNNLAKANTGKIEKLEAELAERYAKKEKEDVLPTHDANKVVKMLDDGLKLNEIANKLKCDHELFIKWYTSNLQAINAAWKRLKRNY